MKKYETEIVEELKKELTKKERIILKLHKKLFVKIYNISRINSINKLIE